jgi:ribosome assembly protein 4
VHFSPDGKHLSTGSGDTTVRFWDLNTQTPYKEGRVHRAWVMACSWSPDAALLATGDKDGVVCLWEGATSECSGSCKGHTKWITSIAWQPLHVRSPSRCFATSSKDGTVRVWDAAKRAQILCMAGSLSSTGFSLHHFVSALALSVESKGNHFCAMKTSVCAHAVVLHATWV